MNAPTETELLDYTDAVYDALVPLVGADWVGERDDDVTQMICDTFDLDEHAEDRMDPERLADRIFESLA